MSGVGEVALVLAPLSESVFPLSSARAHSLDGQLPSTPCSRRGRGVPLAPYMRRCRGRWRRCGFPPRRARLRLRSPCPQVPRNPVSLSFLPFVPRPTTHLASDFYYPRHPNPSISSYVSSCTSASATFYPSPSPLVLCAVFYNAFFTFFCPLPDLDEPRPLASAINTRK
jgi:hypothetical protein